MLQPALDQPRRTTAAFVGPQAAIAAAVHLGAEPPGDHERRQNQEEGKDRAVRGCKSHLRFSARGSTTAAADVSRHGVPYRVSVRGWPLDTLDHVPLRRGQSRLQLQPQFLPFDASSHQSDLPNRASGDEV